MREWRGVRAFALLLTLVALLAHARVYAFLCDDAFISFRYARNLAAGYGLVFNPGLERVEGYTNFLWVMLLAAGKWILGVEPDALANLILVLCTVGLWALVVRRALQQREEGEPWWPALVPPALLAATRSVAVWTTGGLETRLFELLVVAATLRLLDEVARARFPWSGLLFALAALTRPDGLLMAGCAMLAAAISVGRAGHRPWRNWLLQACLFAAPVGAHFLWRSSYYGAWLPNTYYVKAGGRTWWEMGGAYLGAFALEYGVVLWVPLLVLAVMRHLRRGTSWVPLVYAAIVVPHALYVARIGGDHFEYRPLDLYFPFVFLLLGDGVREALRRLRPALVVAYVLAVLVGLAWIPARTHLQFPAGYLRGFPGLQLGRGLARGFLGSAADPYTRAHRALLRHTTARLVGVRAEEHRLFQGVVGEAAGRLRGLIDRGVWPAGLHIALDCVGVVPYRTGLPTFDRLGLTDAEVARSAPSGARVLAHDKHATLAQAAARGVDFWSEEVAQPVMAVSDSRLPFVLAQVPPEERSRVFFADVGQNLVAVGRFPQGDTRGRARFPGLTFHPLDDPVALASLRGRILAAVREALASGRGSLDDRIAAALSLEAVGDADSALAALQSLHPQESVDVQLQLGKLLARMGRFEVSAAALTRATRIDPGLQGGWANLGLALGQLSRWPEARAALERALALDEDDPAVRYSLGVACLRLGDAPCAERQAEALEALGAEGGAQLRSALGK